MPQQNKVTNLGSSTAAAQGAPSSKGPQPTVKESYPSKVMATGGLPGQGNVGRSTTAASTKRAAANRNHASAPHRGLSP